MMAIMSDEIFRLFEQLAPQLACFDEGSPVFRMDDPVGRIYVIRRGMVHLLRHHADGAPLVLQRAGAGSLLAEASLFSDRYHCDAVAVAATEALFVPRNLLLERIGSDGAFAKEWMRHLGREIQKARLQAEIMSIRTVAGRLDAWTAWRGQVPAKGEWGALAAEIGVSPEALYREMAKRRRS